MKSREIFKETRKMDRSPEELTEFCLGGRGDDYRICTDWTVWNQFAEDRYDLSLELVADDLPPMDLYWRLADLYQNHPAELIVPLILAPDSLDRLKIFLEYAPLVRPVDLLTGQVEVDPETPRILAVVVDSGRAETLALLLDHLTRYGVASVEEVLTPAYERAAVQGRFDLMEVFNNYYQEINPVL